MDMVLDRYYVNYHLVVKERMILRNDLDFKIVMSKNV